MPLNFRRFFAWAAIGFVMVKRPDERWLYFLTYLPNCALANLVGLPPFMPDWRRKVKPETINTVWGKMPVGE